MSKTEKETKDIIKNQVTLNLFNQPEQPLDFMPEEGNKKNHQSFILLERKGQRGLLYAGEKSVLEAQVNKAMMRLSSDGWEKKGEVQITVDPRTQQDKDIDDLFRRDHIRLELGRSLLPLVDPGSGAPVLELTKSLRKDMARETGVILPGFRVIDNMTIPFNNYVVFIKETPVASGEIFLERFLVMGPGEALSNLKGWSARDPAFGNPAKWIEKPELETAEKAGCMVMGPLNVMITHLREAVMSNITQLLGLQEAKHMLDRLTETHPVVVEDFLKDKKHLRQVRKILHGLLAERVSIRDLVSIMETIGDHQDKLEKTDFMIEMVRITLGRQICWSYLGPEGKITALALSRKMEDKIQNSIRETKFGFRLAITKEEADKIISHLKKTLEDYENPQVIFCDPPSRSYFRKLTGRNFPGLGILSTAEIDRVIPIEMVGEVELPPGVEPASPAPADKTESEDQEKEKNPGGLFGLFK